MILQQFWNGDDGKYVSDESACRCCRKSDILPVTLNSDINNNVGSATLSHSKKVISGDPFNDLFNLMAQVTVK